MGYEIRDADRGRFAVWELGYHPSAFDMNKEPKAAFVESCDTRQEAEAAIKRWESRDELQARIADFIRDMKSEFGSTLEDKEIRDTIKEAAIG